MDIFVVVLGFIFFTLIAYLLLLGIDAMRKLLETYYDEIFRVLLITCVVFISIQLILFFLIYFESIDYTYNIFNKIIYYNLIWAVPLGLLFKLVRERCVHCKSFETTINEKELVSTYIGISYTGSGDSETSESIYEYLYEVHFICNNCSHEYYRYELRKDNSSSIKVLSEKEAKKYLKKHGASDGFIATLIGLYFFCS